MKRSVLFSYVLLITASLVCHIATAQYGQRGRQMRDRRMARKTEPEMKPSFNLSIGYGFPNLDKNQLAEFYNYYQGSVSQHGPLSVALDYRLTNKISIGLLVTHGKVNAPYYNYNTSAQAFTGSLESYAFMLDLKRYLHTTGKIIPYIRTAFGINAWKENYKDASGNNVAPSGTPQEFAHQAGIGVNFSLSKNSALFIEAGHGKYILAGGLSFKL